MKKILVVRNDKLGDFMLAWPSFAMLKKSIPNSQIIALVPAYTADLARLCPSIDQVIIDAGKNGNKAAQAQTLQAIREKQFDAVINLFSDRYNAVLMWKARIPYRLAPATKIIQFLYNKRIKQRRSQSLKPEYQYNLDLIRAFLQDQGISACEVQAPYLTFSTQEFAQQKQKLVDLLGLQQDKKWIFVHAGSGGSANNLNLLQYAEIVQGLVQQLPCQIILTAGPGEQEKAEQLANLTQLSTERVKIYAKNDGLVDFARTLACADLFIAGSTGPLHLTAALNGLTVGFFPSKRSAKALRWQPVNQAERHLAFTPTSSRAEADEMQSIQPQEVVAAIIPFVHQHWQQD
ncbi:glycosyltransferase family 9 protein [Testudinibacter sp. TR-2022]|uniref:glycosyltransferase family 9 protein n=1 Tax=Testudinibacter sp. TR-2022 TaxID=2585029 RepID=UPI00111AE89B|nr:glycosyltransferase family 9 protein [Testudinibacter sp. TR-2022]TNH07021.1 glycosyltransferase family 9 protein [Pasteurellaceae bacterium Phil11]TNH21762.1 glycosyltransferase family 9 protein [Testudinibacter sp. TR-2022]TNH29075.1 glycosyltransferase family 9 protein [Testudinibacter sp. TR-2022]